jgi:PAS domain S-box-containing protein
LQEVVLDEAAGFAEATARAILAGAADAIVTSDREGMIRVWNAGAERIFGFPASEAIGQSLDIIIPERLRARHWAGYDEVMRTGESRYGHADLLAVPAIGAGGRQLSVEFTIYPIKDASGAVFAMAAVMRDVTARFAEMKALRQRAAAAAN